MKLPSFVTMPVLDDIETSEEIPKLQFREPRWPCDLRVAVWNGMKRISCNLTNISSSGAGFVGVTGIKSGDYIDLRLVEDDIVAEVMWVIRDRCGVKFVKPLKRSEMHALRNGSLG